MENMKKTLCYKQEITVSTSNGSTITRPVTVIRLGEKKSEGWVGDAQFFWDKTTCPHPYPYVTIKGVRQPLLVRKQVAAFLNAWAEEVRRPRETKFCYSKEEAVRVAKEYVSQSNKLPNYISGHPLWLTKNKIAVQCFSRIDGRYLYDRPAIIPVEMKPLVESHVRHYCVKCEGRATCEGPCISPETRSQETTLD